jgi:hypothetical protein
MRELWGPISGCMQLLVLACALLADHDPTDLSCGSLQNGTVKSNAELVKTLNAAEVPGSDIVGEQCPSKSLGLQPNERLQACSRVPFLSLSSVPELCRCRAYLAKVAERDLWLLQRWWWPPLPCTSVRSRNP